MDIDVAQLQRSVDQNLMEKQRNKRHCFICNQLGHLRCNCPATKESATSKETQGASKMHSIWFKQGMALNPSKLMDIGNLLAKLRRMSIEDRDNIIDTLRNHKEFMSSSKWAGTPRIHEEPDTVYIQRIKTMNLPFQFYTVHQVTNEKALLDSGAMENFLNEQVWKTLNIRCFKLKRPLTVHNMDGTENCQGKITHCCWLKIHYQNQTSRMHFFLTNLGKDRFILGYPFLFAFNPEVDWRAAKLKGGPVELEMIGF